MAFIETLYSIHYNHRNRTAFVHRASCPQGHHRNDSRGRWETRVPSTDVPSRLQAVGYKRGYCSKCCS